MTGDKKTILIIENDESIAAALELNLKLESYETRVARDGGEGLDRIHSDSPTLVLLDIGLPNKDGFAVLEELRSSGSSIPVIVLSARHDEYDKVAALRLGADDYVTKPFGLAELIARIDAVLRRTSDRASSLSRFADVEINTETRQVKKAGALVKVTRLEFDLLMHFLNNPERVMSREELLHEVWGTRGSVRTVDNFVGQLRAKLENDPENPQHIVTVRGSGYRLDP